MGLPLTTLSLCPPTDETLYEAPEPIFTSKLTTTFLQIYQRESPTYPQ